MTEPALKKIKTKGQLHPMTEENSSQMDLYFVQDEGKKVENLQATMSQRTLDFWLWPNSKSQPSPEPSTTHQSDKDVNTNQESYKTATSEPFAQQVPTLNVESARFIASNTPSISDSTVESNLSPMFTIPSQSLSEASNLNEDFASFSTQSFQSFSEKLDLAPQKIANKEDSHHDFGESIEGVLKNEQCNASSMFTSSTKRNRTSCTGYVGSRWVGSTSQCCTSPNTMPQAEKDHGCNSCTVKSSHHALPNDECLSLHSAECHSDFTGDYSDSAECGPSSSENQFPTSDSLSDPGTKLEFPNLNKGIDMDQQQHKKDRKDDWLGIPLADMPNLLKRPLELPPLRPASSHLITVQIHGIGGSGPPLPYPAKFRDWWDDKHVMLPCSSRARLLNHQPLWPTITSALHQPILSSYDLEEIILSYRPDLKSKGPFVSLHYFFKQEVEKGRLSWLQSVLRATAELALRLPKICTQPLPLLSPDIHASLSISQLQASCLLSNALFCTFPRSAQNVTPTFNFTGLFLPPAVGRKVEKLRAFFHYFYRVTTSPPSGMITFTRKVLSTAPTWESLTDILPDLYISCQGRIEDDGLGLLQVDFANRHVGGGVLGGGLLQEEIRFTVCPELLIARLVTPSLRPHETLLVTGVERFSKYSGYGEAFCWDGDWMDSTPRDSWGRRLTQVVAMDATCFSKLKSQVTGSSLRRELNKALCGFTVELWEMGRAPGIATGNWGCGAFGGDPFLKALLQLMAAGATRRPVAYFTFGDRRMMKKIFHIHYALRERQLSIGDLFQLLLRFQDQVVKPDCTMTLAQLPEWLLKQIGVCAGD
uniref:poly(ADP-ribose) glycohydrolase n=1 Tax=Eptatretus burgeri TaxID=7764 RepID=A0A8C4Q1H0_EPTBU